MIIKKQIKIEPLPLSYNEQLLWLNLQMDSKNTAYYEPILLKLKGRLDCSRLEAALNLLIQRHDVLRTSFISQDGEAVRKISNDIKAQIIKENIPHKDEEEINSYIKKIFIDESNNFFDISKAPLFRCRLFATNEKEAYLLVIIHHIICETTSMKIFIKDLFSIYGSLSTESRLPENEIEFSDYCWWERKVFYNSNEYKKQKEYWTQKFEKPISYMEMPVKSKNSSKSQAGYKRLFKLPQNISEKITAFSKGNNIPVPVIFLAVINSLLFRYSGKGDIIIAYPVIERSIENTHSLIGFLGNVLLMRIDISKELTFLELLEKAKKEYEESMENLNYPLFDVIGSVNYETETLQSVYQVMFDYIRRPLMEFEIDGLIISPQYEIHNNTVKNELAFAAYDFEGSFALSVEYKSDLYHSSTIETMLSHFAGTLEEGLLNPHSNIGGMRVFEKTRQMNNHFVKNIAYHNPLFVPLKDDDIYQSIQERFIEQADKYPYNVAVKSKSYCFTYKELFNIAKNISKAINLNAREDDKIVAILFSHDALMIAATLGVLFSGRSYVPLEKSFPEERQSYIIEDSGACLILTDSKNMPSANRVSKNAVKAINIEEQLDYSESGDENFKTVHDQAIAYVLYTSGSTGKPKGVLQSHRNALHHLRVWINSMEIGYNDRLSLLSSYGWDSAVSDTFSALLTGAAVYPFDIRMEGIDSLLDWLREEKITVLHATVPLFRTMTDLMGDEVIFPDIRMIPLGGDLTFKKDIERYKKHFSKSCNLVNAFGATESSTCLLNIINKGTNIETNYLPLGYPVESTEVYLVNEAGRQTIPYGTGEIVVSSPYVALGYLNKPKLTEKHFRPNMYFMGDIGQLLPDRSIIYINRKDSVIKIRGYRIELAEIEAALKEQFQVKDAVAIAGDLSSGEKCIIGYIVCKSGKKELDIAGLRNDLGSKLPFFMIPDYFVFIDSIPLTPNRKIDKKALPRLSIASSKVEEKFESDSEKKIYDIWCEVLGTRGIRKTDNFFDIGGNSLHVFKIHSKLQKIFGLKYQITLMFEHPTITSLTKALFGNKENDNEDISKKRAEYRKKMLYRR